MVAQNREIYKTRKTKGGNLVTIYIYIAAYDHEHRLCTKNEQQLLHKNQTYSITPVISGFFSVSLFSRVSVFALVDKKKHHSAGGDG